MTVDAENVEPLKAALVPIAKPDGVLRHLRAHTAHVAPDGRYLRLSPGSLVAETASLPNGWSEGFLLEDPTHTARLFPSSFASEVHLTKASPRRITADGQQLGPRPEPTDDDEDEDDAGRQRAAAVRAYVSQLESDAEASREGMESLLAEEAAAVREVAQAEVAEHQRLAAVRNPLFLLPLARAVRIGVHAWLMARHG